jgi:hypothetical protein
LPPFFKKQRSKKNAGWIEKKKFCFPNPIGKKEPFFFSPFKLLNPYKRKPWIPTNLIQEIVFYTKKTRFPALFDRGIVARFRLISHNNEIK